MFFSNYRKRKKLEVDNYILDYKQTHASEMLKMKKDLLELQQKCASDMAISEHDFHSAKEERGIEIAKLEFKRDSLADEVSYLNKEVMRLKTEISELVVLREQIKI